MSCFPYPRATDAEPIRVPLVARVPYRIADQTSFSKFYSTVLDAERGRLETADSTEQNSSSHSISDSLASACQSSLFFGLAAEALGRDIDFQEFVEADPLGGRPTIDVRIPNWYWRELKTRWDDLDNNLTSAEFEAKRKHFREVYEAARFGVIYVDILANGLDGDLIADVVLSIHMLLYLVAGVVDSGSCKITQTSTAFASTKLLKRRMIDNGWCAKRLNFLNASPLFYPTFYFLSSLRPPRARAEDHSKCSEETCLIASKLSKPLHRSEQCLCTAVPVPVEKVNAIITTGRIPLIRITRSSVGQIQLEVIPYDNSLRYVAISHVWADQQFGSAQNSLPKCQVRYLEEVLASLPTAVEHWRLRDWVSDWWYPQEHGLVPPSQPYQYFWLDSFCIPQAVERAELRSKAIESMNLIYAAASNTLVFDKGLQTLNAGRRPASLKHNGRPSYYSPQDSDLLDVVASIYASNWMGRAWTLQEGILSGSIIFPLHGSMAFLKLLWPYHDDGSSLLWGMMEYLVSTIPEDVRRTARDFLPRGQSSKLKLDEYSSEGSEPYRESVRSELFTQMKGSLNVEDYRKYARTPGGRAARFVKAHALLQSRTTTQAGDIPLILMNMSCMNANAISHSQTSDARMKQLFYGIETLPTELLFSSCVRPGPCSVDSWIPREIAPETFKGDHTLKLSSTGWTFETKKGATALRQYIISATQQLDRFTLVVPDQKKGKSIRYDVGTIQGSSCTVASTKIWGIVITDGPEYRGARFVLNRVVGGNYYVHYDCPLRLNEIDEEEARVTQGNAEHQYDAIPLDKGFIIERSHDSQELSISRPQNPEQYSDRLIVIGQMICGILSWGERLLIRKITGDENGMGVLFYLVYGIFHWKQREWVEKALNAFVHRAWMATYQPDWDPNGPWKWYWRLTNWEPPVPFRTLMKWWCQLMFFLCFNTKFWTGVFMVTTYWLPLYPKQELFNMYVNAIVMRFVLSFIF